VEVARYHSDNGVFTAAEFQEDCKLKYQQQTFSGVGAKHQNGRAERSIQTIMSIARTFMIHVSLHWDEQGSDAVALWPFAVCHAVWLYNRLPNGLTGLSPMEIVAGTHSDHQDLLCTHVWGCPV
jgi:transposase InsO family protein